MMKRECGKPAPCSCGGYTDRACVRPTGHNGDCCNLVRT